MRFVAWTDWPMHHAIIAGKHFERLGCFAGLPPAKGRVEKPRKSVPMCEVCRKLVTRRGWSVEAKLPDRRRRHVPHTLFVRENAMAVRPFLVFSFPRSRDDATGGWHDFVDSFATLDEAKRCPVEGTFIQVVDLTTGKVVY